jgi:hypothetical protein
MPPRGPASSRADRAAPHPVRMPVPSSRRDARGEARRQPAPGSSRGRGRRVPLQPCVAGRAVGIRKLPAGEWRSSRSPAPVPSRTCRTQSRQDALETSCQPRQFYRCMHGRPHAVRRAFRPVNDEVGLCGLPGVDDLTTDSYSRRRTRAYRRKHGEMAALSPRARLRHQRCVTPHV